jgi:hypothetical protein
MDGILNGQVKDLLTMMQVVLQEKESLVLLEKYKYDELMKMDKDIVKLYFVNDPKGNFLYWLNTLELPEPKEMYCPDTTLWTKKRLLKPVYLLKENQATKINLN